MLHTLQHGQSVILSSSVLPGCLLPIFRRSARYRRRRLRSWHGDPVRRCRHSASFLCPCVRRCSRSTAAVAAAPSPALPTCQSPLLPLLRLPHAFGTNSSSVSWSWYPSCLDLVAALGPRPLRRDPVFMLLLLLGRRLRSLRRIFRFRLRLATDMRDEAAGAHRGKGVSWRLAAAATGASAALPPPKKPPPQVFAPP